MSAIEIIAVPLDANQTRDLRSAGEYFELRNALQAIAMVELCDRAGAVLSRLVSPEQSDFVRTSRAYELVRITNGPVAQTIRYFCGNGEAGSRRTSGLVQVEGTISTEGIVEVVDGGKQRSLAAAVFSGISYCPNSAGNYSCVQLWNPAASGKRAVLSQIIATISSGGGAFVVLKSTNAALPNLFGNPANKLLGGANSIMELRNQTPAAIPVGVAQLGNIGCPAINTSNNYKLTEPIVLPPGFGLMLASQNTATDLAAVFEFFEEAHP